MRLSLQEQLQAIQPALQARRDLEALFVEGGKPSTTAFVFNQEMWDKAYEVEVKRLLKSFSAREDADRRARVAEVCVDSTVMVCLSVFLGSCLFMISKSCINSDKGPKFSL